MDGLGFDFADTNNNVERPVRGVFVKNANRALVGPARAANLRTAFPRFGPI